MNQLYDENNSLNNYIKENKSDFIKTYNKTSPINNSPMIDSQKVDNFINNIKYCYPTSIEKKVKSKIDLNLNNINNINNKYIQTVTHNDTSLVKNIELLDNDNIKLREALSELNLELKEKEEGLKESQKILKKINDEYSQLVKEYKNLEEKKILYEEENEKNKKLIENLKKELIEKEKIRKQNEIMKEEIIKNKETTNNLKCNYSNITNNYNKIEKENKDKEIIINDLKNEGNKIINMIKERDLLIEEYSKKIKELNEIIKQKDDKLKLMLNVTKEINNENKINVKELTKQAVKTIKVFYNTMNNNKNKDNNIGQTNFIEIKNNKERNINKNNISDIIFGNNISKDEKKIKCSFLLNEAIENVLYIPEIGINYINKEFLVDNNFKTILLKTELFSSIIREIEFYNFFNDKFIKLNDIIKELNLEKKERKKKFGEYLKNINFKIIFDKINKNIIKYKKENDNLKLKLKELVLYINKLKNDFGEKIRKIKEKMKNIYEKYNIYINNLEEKIKEYENENNKDNKENKLNEKKEEISKLYKEIDKIKNINDNMNEEIKEKEEIINKLKKENENILYKLNNLRINPNAENNIKFYNSFSLYNNKQKGNKNMNLSDLSNYNNNNNINNTNKILNFNSNDFDFSLNDNISYNSMKYSTKATSKKNNKRRNIRNIIRNVNELSSNTYNDNNENDITNKFFGSRNFDIINLKIENKDNFSYFSENQNYEILDNNLLNNILIIINNFKSELKEENFNELVNKIFKIIKIIKVLNNKIEEIKNNISNTKEKFQNNNKSKKIKSLHLIEIMEQIEKLLLYVNNHLNKTNNEMENIQPYLKNIFDLVSKIVYDSPLSTLNNSSDITPYTIGLNTFQNSTIINNNNNPNNKNNIKDNIIKNNEIMYKKRYNNNKIINKENEDINNNINYLTRTKESILPNITELKQFFDINKKIFSSSELIKYKIVYKGLSMDKILQVFKDICDNLKKTIYNSKNEYDSDMSDLEESNIFEESKNNQIINDNCSYHIVNEKIFGLKKFEFNYKIFMELLKNYLVTFEIIVNQIEIEINNKNREKQIELGEELNILYNIFEDAVYYKMDILDDDVIFNRKMILKLLLNHKEYLSIIYDI